MKFFQEMFSTERNAYKLGVEHGVVGTAVVVAFPCLVAKFLVTQDELTATILPTAQASEPEGKDLFVLTRPADACQYGDDLVAWKRDDRFTTQLRVWCLERSDGEEGDTMVVWNQTEKQRFASRHVVQQGLYSHKMLADAADKTPYVDACRGDGFLGWSKRTASIVEGGVTRRGDGDEIEILGFYGGNLWCVGEDLYVLSDGIKDDNPRDTRLDIARGVDTTWAP